MPKPMPPMDDSEKRSKYWIVLTSNSHHIIQHFHRKLSSFYAVALTHLAINFVCLFAMDGPLQCRNEIYQLVPYWCVPASDRFMRCIEMNEWKVNRWKQMKTNKKYHINEPSHLPSSKNVFCSGFFLLVQFIRVSFQPHKINVVISDFNRKVFTYFFCFILGQHLT